MVNKSKKAEKIIISGGISIKILLKHQNIGPTIINFIKHRKSTTKFRVKKKRFCQLLSMKHKYLLWNVSVGYFINQEFAERANYTLTNNIYG